MSDIVKSCTKYVKQHFGVSTEVARELVAAFFGYASYEDLEQEENYSPEELTQAEILIPTLAPIRARIESYGSDGVHIYSRIPKLSDKTTEFADELTEHLIDSDFFSGQVWDGASLEEYLLDEYLPSNIFLDDELADVIAETNAYFDEPSYETAKVECADDEVVVTVTGTYGGEPDLDRAYHGSDIDFEMKVTLTRVAGLIGFSEPSIETRGEVRLDYEEEEEEAPPAKPRKSPRKKKAKKANKFFNEQRIQSKVKAEIVHEYFTQWSKVMGTNVSNFGNKLYTKDLLYLDLYSGQGYYEDGQDSTPLLILKEAINTPALHNKLTTVFNDAKKKNIKNLEQAIAKLDVSKLKMQPQCFVSEVGKDIVNTFENRNLPFTLLFVDPFGYKGLSIDLINAVIKDFGSECIFFFNFNRVQAGIKNPLVEKHMLLLFGNKDRLQRLKALRPGNSKEKKILNEFFAALKEKHAKYICAFRFLSPERNATSHYLIFVTKHHLGFQIMNSIMAKKSTHGPNMHGCYSFECDPLQRPPQTKLIDPTRMLADELYDIFKGQKIWTTKDKPILRGAPASDLDTIFFAHASEKPFIRANYVEAIKKLTDQGRVTLVGQIPRKRTDCGPKTQIQFN